MFFVKDFHYLLTFFCRRLRLFLCLLFFTLLFSSIFVLFYSSPSSLLVFLLLFSIPHPFFHSSSFLFNPPAFLLSLLLSFLSSFFLFLPSPFFSILLLSFHSSSFLLIPSPYISFVLLDLHPSSFLFIPHPFFSFLLLSFSLFFFPSAHLFQISSHFWPCCSSSSFSELVTPLFFFTYPLMLQILCWKCVLSI